MQQTVRQRFRELQETDEADGQIPWHIVDAAQSIEDVQKDIENLLKPNSIYIYERVKMNMKHRQNTIFSFIDYAEIDLYLLQRKSRAPIGMFDDTFFWLNKHYHSLCSNNVRSTQENSQLMMNQNIPSRKVFVNKMYEKVYSKEYVKAVKPKVKAVYIGNNHSLNVTMFDFREVLVDFLSNDDIMNIDTLMFYDRDNPSAVHPRNSDVGEIITSDVFLNAHKRLCKKENDVLFPLIMYSDAMNFDMLGKLKLDPLSFTLGRLPLRLRNKALAWRYFGFVDSIKHHETDSELDAKTNKCKKNKRLINSI